MRIHGLQRNPAPAKTTERSRERGSFLALLQTKMEKIQYPDPGEKTPARDEKSWDIVKDAARLLDLALDQITSGAEPDEEILEQLQGIQQHFHNHAGNDKQLQEVELLLTIEHQRILSM